MVLLRDILFHFSSNGMVSKNLYKKLTKFFTFIQNLAANIVPSPLFFNLSYELSGCRFYIIKVSNVKNTVRSRTSQNWIGYRTY